MSDDPRVGTELAGYRIVSLLGFGGMSIVYLAEDLRLKRRVALKLMAAGLAEDESFRDRFLRESELAASIDHPNIVPIYEAGATEDLLFIAMRYVEGRDLKERLQRGRLDPGEATSILAQVASALDAAHGRGLVHRDVKPSNVLLDLGARPDGSDHVYLADFGLTRRVSDESGAGEDGHLMGTIDYVAPEQIAGAEVDGRADVYSLGCVLYECLVGQPPFHRDSEIAVVFAHLEMEPPVTSAARPELPAALDGIIARALAKEPEERYASCRELARAALAVTVDEAGRRLAEAASRAAAGRSDLTEAEAELAGTVLDLQLAREQARALSGTPTPTRLAAHGVCPFKGLASFEPVDAEYFFGRERLVAELVARLVGAGFLGIVGPSGSGKSSVLRAGLLPALAGGVLPGSEGWRRLLLRPGERPLEELRRVLVSGAKDPVAEALDTLPPGGRLLLAVDQVEELFTACPSEAERAAFAETLARAAADADRRAVVVVASRADFYGRFAAYPALAELMGANHVLVGPMQASELRRVVELPATRVGLRVEPELADALVDDVEGEPGALPLLSTALLELWQKRDDDLLALAAYRESGGVHGAVARLAESTYARVPDEQKPLVRALMLRLVAEGEGDAAVRRRAPLAELDLERNEAAERVLTTLADSRLVTVSEGTVEVAHEALLREWPRLREWIEEDSQGRRLRHHLTRAATDWDATGRDTGELYRGARLAAALDWTADHALDLNELEREFVTQSRDVSEKETTHVRRTNRRLRVLLGGVAVLLAVAVAGGFYAIVQRGEARNAADQARAAETAQLAQRLGAQALVEEDLGLSLLLARQAVATQDTPQTRGYLLDDLRRSGPVIRILRGPDDTSLGRGIALSRDGKRLAVVGAVGLVLFDTRTLEPIAEPAVPADSFGPAAFHPDGKRIALGGNGGLRLIDGRTGKLVAEAPIAGDVTDLQFTSDGKRLVAVESTPEGPAWITIRDADTLRSQGLQISPSGFSGRWLSQWWTDPSIVVTPDSRSLVTTSQVGELTWWDLDTHRVTRRIRVPDGFRALAVSQAGRMLAIGLDSGLETIDVRTGAVRKTTGVIPSSPTWLRFSPDDKTLAATSRDGSVTLWDPKTVTLRETLDGHSDSAWQPVFSRDSKTLYTTSSDGTAIAWDLGGTRRFVRRFRFTDDRGLYEWPDRHPGRFSPDGRLIAIGLNEEGITLRDARTLAQTGVLRKTGGEVTALAWSADGKTLAAVADSRTLTIWDLPSRSLRKTVAVGFGAIGVSISADGKMIATTATNGVTLWSSATGASLGSIDLGYSVGDVAFSPTEPLLAIIRDGYLQGGGGDTEIWDVAERRRLQTLDVDGELGWVVAFSPDGRLLGTSGIDRLVHVWDVHTGKLVREIEQNVGNAVWSLEFSPDNRVLAISGGDPHASLWDLATGAQIGPRLRGVGSRETMVDLSPDGHRLLMTHADGKGAVWNLDAESWATRACTIAGRTLSREEWEEFLPGRAYEPACR